MPVQVATALGAIAVAIAVDLAGGEDVPGCDEH